MRINRKKEAALSAERLRDILYYNPRIGLFVRTKTVHGGSAVAGQIVGSRHHSGYLSVGIGGYQYLIHRLAWFWMTGDWPSRQIDHIDGNRGNNRWDNLRLATQVENSQNSHIPQNNTSGYTGVHFQKAAQKWQAYIRVNRKRIHLGYFDSCDDAAMCRNYHAAYLFGNFARLGRNPEWTHD